MSEANSPEKLPSFSKAGDVLVVIETCKGSRNKYAYNAEY